MLTKSDFLQAVDADIDNYPAIAPLYRAGDPRIMQQIGAQATMLAMLSAQLETAMMESFDKVRDSTILADAAMRGIVPKAISPRVRLTVTNKNASPYTVEIGRVLLDASGLAWNVETSAIVTANGSSTVEAVQQTMQTVVHTVAGSRPFYSVEIPDADDGSYLAGISVSDADGDYEYRQRYVNSWPDERIFHVEADDRQRVYVRFGYADVVGVQPTDGAKITLSITRTSGDVSMSAGSPLSFEYLQFPADSKIEFAMDALLLAGQAPIDLTALRDLARYPSVYDHNAVFLGEFDHLVRQLYPTLKLLSVWNESAEEIARGASIDNINVLFVACLSADGLESVIDEPDPNTPVSPIVIAEASLTATQKAIRETIRVADDSYVVRFYTPVRSKIVMSITADVATSYIASDVREKIIDAVLDEFGIDASASRRGNSKPLYQRIYAMLKERIVALSGNRSDIVVDIVDLPSSTTRPEMWRYVAADSLTVTVNTVNTVAKSWGG